MSEPATRAELQQLSRLAQPRERRELGRVLVEGPRLLAEALDAGLVPLLVAWSPERGAEWSELLRRAERAGARVVQADAERLGRAGPSDQGQGLLAACALPAVTPVADPPAEGAVLELALAGLQDPGNVGTLVRAARAFGAGVVWLGAGCADPLGPKALRASAGQALHAPQPRSADVQALVARAAAHGLTPALAVTPRERPEATALPARCLLVLGHETRGVPELPGALRVTVPQRPQVESLNVAMAGAALMAGWYAREHDG